MTAARVVLALAAFACAGAAPAMTLDTRGPLLFASGEVGNDLGRFEDALAGGTIHAVVFLNSPGGDLWTAVRVGRLIAARGLVTVAAGRCASACAIMFVGGRERRIASGLKPGQAWLGIHGAHNRDTRQIEPALQPQIYAFFKQQLGERFDAAVMNRALYEMDDAQAMLLVPLQSAGRLPNAVHCRSAARSADACQPQAGADALSLGLVTDTAPYPIEPRP